MHEEEDEEEAFRQVDRKNEGCNVVALKFSMTGGRSREHKDATNASKGKLLPFQQIASIREAKRIFQIIRVPDNLETKFVRTGSYISAVRYKFSQFLLRVGLVTI